jgi:predicted NBD/HSP70 family sugar kinase
MERTINAHNHPQGFVGEVAAVHPKKIKKLIDCKCGVDIGGKFTKAAVKSRDGKSGYAEVATHKREDSLPAEDRVKGLVGSTVSAIEAACEKAGIKISEIQALGFGAPGARDPVKKTFRMPNAIGKDTSGKVAEVDFEGPLRKELIKKGLSPDAVVRGGNDCDIAAASEKFGELKIIQAGRGEVEKLAGRQERVFILLGTGIGVGVADKDGINEGSSGKMEGGHLEVSTTYPELSCGCGKKRNGSVCIEAASSTTGMENLAKIIIKRAVSDPNLDDAVKSILQETLKWNEKKAQEGVDDNERAALNVSADSIVAIMSNFGEKEDVKKLLNHVVFDAAVIDKLTEGKNPNMIAYATMLESGMHFGRYLSQVITLRNPAEIIIGGGGARLFSRGDEMTNPFWVGMNKELSQDPFGAVSDTRIQAIVGGRENLGINGGMKQAELEYLSY